MTKRDVAVWFCRVWALTGMFSAAFVLAVNILNWLLTPGVRGFAALGNFPYSLPHLATSVFLWLFAAGIGTELAAEGEHGPPIASIADLKVLLPRCVGLAVFLSSTASLALTLLQFGVFRFSPSIATLTAIIQS